MMTIKKWKFPSGLLSLWGTSRAAHGTALYIPELKWGLDAGIGGIEHIFTCFVTHGHLDHTLVIPGIVSAYSVYHISFADTITLIMYNKAAQIYVPTEITDFVHSVVQSSMEMNWGEKIDAKKGNFPKPYCDREFPYPYDIFPCVPSENHKVDSKHMVSIIKCDHTVPCIGYCFYESRTRLKNEYKGLSKEEMVQLRKKNVEVSEQAKFPLFAFLGDTTHEVFVINPQLFEYPVIIVECTFLYDEHIQESAKSKHMHWKYLQPFVVANPKCTFVLIHFSLRYTDKEVSKFFDEMGEKKPENIVPWVLE